MHYPLSQEERAAMSRHLTGLRRQLHEVSDLFSTRYGRDSNVGEIAVKTLLSLTLLEHELMVLDSDKENTTGPTQPEWTSSATSGR